MVLSVLVVLMVNDHSGQACWGDTVDIVKVRTWRNDEIGVVSIIDIKWKVGVGWRACRKTRSQVAKCRVRLDGEEYWTEAGILRRADRCCECMTDVVQATCRQKGGGSSAVPTHR